jgi:hypothetical protein
MRCRFSRNPLWWADATSGDKTAAETNDQGVNDEQGASLDERHDVKSDRGKKMKKERRGRGKRNQRKRRSRGASSHPPSVGHERSGADKSPNREELIVARDRL